MEYDTHVTHDGPMLSLNWSRILSYLPSGIFARIRRGQPRHPIDAFGVPSQTSISSAIASLVEETGWVAGTQGSGTSRSILSIDKTRQPSFPSPWAFFTSGYMLGLLIVAFVLYRMQNIILPSRTPVRNRREFANFMDSRNGTMGRRYSFMRHVFLRRMFSSMLPLDISKTRTRLALQLPSLCVLTKMLIIWSLLVLQACDKMPNWSWIQWLGAWSEEKEMAEICWSTFCAVGSAFCVEGFIRALDGMSTTFALSSQAGPNASPFNLIGYAFLLHVYSSPLTHVRKPDGLPSRPDKHVIITIAIPLLQLTMFHYLSISKRLSSHRLLPTTLTSVLSLLHFHTTLYSRLLSSKSVLSASPTVLPSTSTSTSPTPITPATIIHASTGLQSGISTTNEFSNNYPLLNYIPNMFETVLLSTILLTVALNAVVQLLVRGRIERPFIGLGIINNSDDGQSAGWFSSLRNLPWDRDFAVLLLHMSTATLEATGLRGWGNEVAPIPTPLPAPLSSTVHRRRRITEEIEYGRVKMGKLRVESLAPGHIGTVSSGSAFGSRYMTVRENADSLQRLFRRRPVKDDRRKKKKVLKGYINEVRSIDVGADNEETPGNPQNVETRDQLLFLERRWVRAFGAFVRVLWGTLRGTYRWLSVTSRSIVGGQRRTVDDTGLPKEDLSRIASGMSFYVEAAEEDLDDMDESEADHEFYARFLRGEDLSDDDSGDSTFSDGADESESDSDSSRQDELGDDMDSDDSLSTDSSQHQSVWERLRGEAMQLFSDLVDNHVDDDSSMVLAHMAYPRSGGPLTRRRLESVVRTRQQLENEGEDEFERVRREVMYKMRNNNNIPCADEEERVRRLCVICTVQERDIICWPCRCMTMCDNCRDALSSRGAPGKHRCPCCRSSVEGYSKIYIP